MALYYLQLMVRCMCLNGAFKFPILPTKDNFCNISLYVAMACHYMELWSPNRWHVTDLSSVIPTILAIVRILFIYFLINIYLHYLCGKFRQRVLLYLHRLFIITLHALIPNHLKTVMLFSSLSTSKQSQ